MAAKAQEQNKPIPNENEEKGKTLVNANGDITKLVEWATVGANSIEDLEQLFADEGVSYSDGSEVTGEFRVVTAAEKQLWCQRVSGNPAFVIKWDNRSGDKGDYVTIHLFVAGHGKFIVNDGSKAGMCGQLSRIESERLRANPEMNATHARVGVKVGRGIVKNDDFYYDDRNGKAIKKAEMNLVPPEHCKLANPTWRFEF